MIWEILIPLLVVGLQFITVALELLMKDRNVAKELEFTIIRKQRKIKELQKAKDTDAMMAANKELMSLMGKKMKLQQKTMLISFPLFLFLFFFVLYPVLNVAPLTAGEFNPVGVYVKNLDAGGRTLLATLDGESEVMVNGSSTQDLELSPTGVSGDNKELWWGISSSVGDRQYTIVFTDGATNDSQTYNVHFSEKGALTPDFSPDSSEKKTLSESLNVKPLYKGVEITLFGMTIGWFIYYFAFYLVLSIAMSPIKNRIIWGHHKGVKHLEKMASKKKKEEK